MNNKEYQHMELKRFYAQKDKYFDTVKEFSDDLESMDILEQIEWIENGTYGAGACFAMQKTLKNLTPRMNHKAHVGGICLHTFYGKQFPYWQKLSDAAKEKINQAVAEWMKQKHAFAHELE